MVFWVGARVEMVIMEVDKIHQQHYVKLICGNKWFIISVGYIIYRVMILNDNQSRMLQYLLASTNLWWRIDR